MQMGGTGAFAPGPYQFLEPSRPPRHCRMPGCGGRDGQDGHKKGERRDRRCRARCQVDGRRSIRRGHESRCRCRVRFNSERIGNRTLQAPARNSGDGERAGKCCAANCEQEKTRPAQNIRCAKAWRQTENGGQEKGAQDTTHCKAAPVSLAQSANVTAGDRGVVARWNQSLYLPLVR